MFMQQKERFILRKRLKVIRKWLIIQNSNLKHVRHVSSRVHLLNNGNDYTAGQFVCEADSSVHKRARFLQT